MTTGPVTAAELLLAHRDRDEVALSFEDRTVTYREWIDESRRRAVLWQEIHDPDQPPHIGVLLDNTPDYLFWLGAAAL